MSKRHSSKYKIDRRLGENIWGRPKSSVNRRSDVSIRFFGDRVDLLLVFKAEGRLGMTLIESGTIDPPFRPEGAGLQLRTSPPRRSMG